MSQDKDSPSHLDYRSAGVDIDAGNRLVERIKTLAGNTARPGVLGGIGSFGALFELPVAHYRQPVLVSSTDGVGTKLKLAIELGKHDTIGIDLVAMCANDVVVQGAEPLFFLDYYATGRLREDTAEQIVTGIASGCQTAGMSLIGGETAEMPGLYQDQDYDLAGFCVGLAEKDRLVDGHLVEADDVLIGLASSGPHANGYSLIRKILAETGHRLSDPFDGGAPGAGGTLGDVLLEPTRIYVKPLLELMGHVPVHAMAHITGGGLVENIPRVLPEALRATITTGAWQVPPVFAWLEKQGGVPINEMYRTFNCGIGMVVCVAPDDAETALQRLREAGEQAWIIGSVETRGQAQEPLVLRD